MHIFIHMYDYRTCMLAVLSTALKRGSTSLEPLDALDTGANSDISYHNKYYRYHIL